MPDTSTQPRSPADNRARVGTPPGVMPKNIPLVVIAGIVILVITSTIFSGSRSSKVETATATTGPSLNQLKSFQQQIEKGSREAEEARRALELLAEERRRQEAPGSRYIPPSISEPDPFAQKRRERAEGAPYATSFIYSAPVSAEPLALDHSPQFIAASVTAAEEQKGNSKPEPPKATPSGQLKPAREGIYYRLYESTRVETRLENRLEGSFTGPVICVVAKDVLSVGKPGTLLIPKGSRFIGKASQVVAENQTRLAVTFKRLLMPNGYSVELDSAPGLDRLGEAGLKDQVNNHWLRTFGVSGAIGLLGGLALYGTQGNPYAAGVANTTGNAATNALNHFLNAAPTLTIREGHAVVVYLPGDLLLPQYTSAN